MLGYGKWNKDGTPDFKTLENDDRKVGQHNIRKADGSGVPLSPIARWNEDGSPDFSQFDEPLTTNEDFGAVLKMLRIKHYSVGDQIFKVMTVEQKQEALDKIRAGTF